jgi:hypothetical protein
MRMRATKGYAAGIGTTSALIGAIGCAFAVLSTVVAVHGWPLALGAPSTSTLESPGAAAEEALPSLGALGTAEAARRAPADRSVGAHPSAGVVPVNVEPVASAFGPSAGAPTRRSASGGTVAAGPAAGTASPGRATGSDAVARPAPATRSDSDAGEPTQSPTPTPMPPPSSGSGSAPTLGGTVAEVTSGAGTAVSQTGQQLGGAVQGATSQLGGTVGQVSPAVGQAVTQTGQVVGGVVSGATGAAGQVVSGTGATVVRLLGRLTGGR